MIFRNPPTNTEPCRNAGSSLVGLKVVSLVGTRSHSPLGTAWVKYAMAARHWASIEGRENAGPQTCNSKIIALGWSWTSIVGVVGQICEYPQIVGVLD